MSTSDIARKRSVLLSARMRFSPETQPIRETAIDKMIEQNLLVGHGEEGLTVQEIEAYGEQSFACGFPVFSRMTILRSLYRLMKIGRVEEMKKSSTGHRRFRLAKDALVELTELQRAAESRFSNVVGRLFRDVGSAHLDYETALLECLCTVFSQLSYSYVKLISGQSARNQILSSPSIRESIRDVARKYNSVDKRVFEAGVYRMFRDSDPGFDAIKWNIAQNYYVSQVLGLDPSGRLLSKEIFHDAVFYLDTNVVIDAVEPKARYHRSFSALGRACEDLQTDLKVCRISIEELKSLVEYQSRILEKVASQIPDDTAPKVSGVFFGLYRESLAERGQVDFDQVFGHFRDAAEVLSESYKVDLVDNGWFDEAVDEEETEELAQRIKAEYVAKCRRVKGQGAAIHDALMLRWIEIEREHTNTNTWFVTLDATLPSFMPRDEDGQSRSMAITLDALLQWISPMGISDDAEDEMAAIFSEAVKRRILPQEGFFELKDFLIFAEMEWSCKELPSEDVEECIHYLRGNAPNLDPTNAVDREKLAHAIAKFFADPGRKYRQEVYRLEQKIARIEEARERVLAETKAESQLKLKEQEQASARLADHKQNQIRDYEARIAGLKRDNEQLKRTHQDETLKRSAHARMLILAPVILLLEGTAVVLAHLYGGGDTLFERIVNSWPIVALALVIWLGLCGLVLGKERIRRLGWPFSRWLQGD